MLDEAPKDLPLSISLLLEARAGCETAGQLWERVRLRYPQVKFDNFRMEFNDLISKGLLELEEVELRDFLDYLGSYSFGFRFWLVTLATLGAVVSVEFLNAGFPFVVVNWILGTFLVLIAPGFALTWALFPSRQSPSGLNRLALTIAMSLFLVAAVGLVFNYTPLGITPQPIAWTLAALTIALVSAGAYREFLLHSRR